VASGTASEAAVLPETGALLLTTAPAGALIFLDGQDTGLKTPNLFERLAAGKHRVNLRLEGFRAVEVECAILPGQTARRELALSESFGQAVFDVRPTAKILLDGSPLIETPYVQPVRIRSGRHSLTLINEQLGVRREVAIEIREGETLRIVEVLK
jgi:hypothetical protein